jgi:CHAT domain-containing protein/Tfp pilus assembly protein PilF
MKKMFLHFMIFFFSIFCVGVFSQETKPCGIVVESVEKGSAGEKAGIKAGDAILSWELSSGNPCLKNQTGVLRSPFDLWYVEIEKAPRGKITLRGRRGNSRTSWTMPPGGWKINADVISGGGAAASAWLLCKNAAAYEKAGNWEEAVVFYNKALSLTKNEKKPETESAVYYLLGTCYKNQSRFDDAISAYKEHIRLEKTKRGDDLVVANALNQTGSAMFRKGDLDGAEEVLMKAFGIVERSAPGSVAYADSLNKQGILAKTRDDFDSAQNYFKRSLAIYNELIPDGLDAAAILNNLGVTEQERGNFPLAESYHQQALAIKESIAPDSLDAAASYNNIGVVAKERGDLRLAEECYEKSLAIKMKSGPENLDVAATLNNLGGLAYERGDLALSEDYHRRSLLITSKLAPDSLDEARDLGNLGNIAEERGDLIFAEECHKKALEITEKLSPGSLDAAYSYNCLGNIEFSRDNLSAAADYHKKALEIRTRVAPGSLDVSESLNNLGVVADEAGDSALAENYYRRSLEIMMKAAPDSADVALDFNNLGALASDRGDLDVAESYYKKSLDIILRLSPGGISQAASFDNLGHIAEKRGDLEAAMKNYKASLEIRRQLEPGSADEAETFHRIGSVFRQKKDLKSALIYFKDAVSALDSQTGKLGGGRETRERFSAKYSDYYRDLVEAEVELGMKEEAMATLEKFRARSLLEMLAERDLDFGKDAPADLLGKHKNLLSEYGRIQNEMADLSPENDADKIAAMRKSLEALGKEEDEVKEEMKRSSPKLASLQYPEPLDAGKIKELFGKDALLLSYSAGNEMTELFALLNGELIVYNIPVERDELKNEVIGLRRFLSDPGSDKRALTQKSRKLYDHILKPAENLIKRSKLVVLCPDGPLHYIPFQVLMDGRSRYLIEQKPVINIISATVLCELAKGGHNTADNLIAFGNPGLPAGSAEDGETRSAAAPGGHLSDLPAAEAEVDSIGLLYGARATILKKSDATEEKAKSIGKDISFIHFACHGILDERFPLNSGLALAAGEKAGKGKESGLFQAWEIFEGLRLNADLVALSACETALGKEMGGEGLIGLTRAFQYAGAKTVLSSLWSVSDESTAFLMKNFYSFLKQGKTKAEALRLAQLDMIRSESQKRYAHPFYWAGFVLNGDWK